MNLAIIKQTHVFKFTSNVLEIYFYAVLILIIRKLLGNEVTLDSALLGSLIIYVARYVAKKGK